MSNIVLKDRQGTKQTYSGVEVIKIADSEGNYNNYVAEPTGEIEITANGSVDVSKYASARVAVPSGSVTEWDGTGVVIAPIETVEPNTFTINGISYTMENRMTWYAWTRSDYNTDGFSCPAETGYVYEAESSNRVTDAEGNEVLGTNYISEGSAYLIKEVVTTDELAGTWVFNDTLDGTIDSTFNFVWDSISFTRMTFDGAYLEYYNADYTTGYDVYEEFWRTDDKTIIITSKLSEVTNGSTLLAWLKANATKRDASSEPGDGTDPEPV